jgi:hypothetical protein
MPTYSSTPFWKDLVKLPEDSNIAPEKGLAITAIMDGAKALLNIQS